jgi:4-alpha-glucanotransferase
MPRHAGVILPLFSTVSTSSWGIGELPDLAPLSRWLSSAGFDRLMLLPLGTMPEGETSPYSAMSAMAIDPVYISVERLEDLPRANGAAVVPEEIAQDVDSARGGSRIQYAIVRRAKICALTLAFDRFHADEWGRFTTRAASLAAYIARERWWLDDYALYRALAETLPDSWRKWPEPLRDREPKAIDDARRQLAREVLRHQYWQWIAESQWQAARAVAREHGVTVFGDLPFVVGADSVDVWSRAHEFRLDVSTGVPPDAFSETGQDWGLPMYRWNVIEEGDYAWLRQRARRMSALFDGFRVDHLVGFYRTYGRPEGGDPFFSPAEEHLQVRQGEAVLTVFRDAGAEILAEDLGVVPDFVRASLARLGVPGCKVLRWERDWHSPGHPFLPPEHYTPVSVAMTGTHDTESLAAWWDAAQETERVAAFRLPWFAKCGLANHDGEWTEQLRDAFLELAYQTGSNDVFFPMQDVFGWRDRINTPATVGDANWTWRLPLPVDRLLEDSAAIERARFCRAAALAAGRGVAVTSST